MREYIAHALVLGSVPKGNDRMVDLLTRELGRVEARMVAGRALTSKFAPQCDPLGLLMVRLVKKNRYTLADAVTEDRFTALRRRPRALAESLEALFALRSLLAHEEPDPRLFYEVRRALASGALTVRKILVLLGYDPAHARCAHCRARSVAMFIPDEGVFYCRACLPAGQERFALRGDKVILKL